MSITFILVRFKFTTVPYKYVFSFCDCLSILQVGTSPQCQIQFYNKLFSNLPKYEF